MMWTTLWEPFRRVFAVIESVVAFFVILIYPGQKAFVGDYAAMLNKSGVFVNQAQEAYPQTVMHDVVMHHFAKSRTNGKTPKCLIIGFDGARADALFNSVGQAKSGVQEALKSGAAYQLYTGGKFPYLQQTVTACGWTTLLTGHWAKEPKGGGHRVTANYITKAANAPQLLFTELLDQKKAEKTAFIVSWDGHFASEKAAYLNDIADNQSKGNNALWLTMPGDAGAFTRTLQEVSDPGGADVVMCILESCDSEGHATGFGNQNPKYVQAFLNADANAYDLIQAVNARPAIDQEDWLILFTSDHGGMSTGHGQWFATERLIYLVSNQAILPFK
ncbi:MAG: alkaline phosphatase family protein [Oscillospiraceae bacterium]|jgi:hypothetical protein|nr:alkaline phosphatase family protein [Oscillospiraceae bacterium]